jgi:hypothetical protein
MPQPTQHQQPGLPAVPAIDEHRPQRLGEAAGRVLRFLLHFAEMWIAMLLGMAVFDPVKLGLAALGYTSLLDPMSIDSEVEMMVFMVAPVVLWMRVRGWCWRDGAEMTMPCSCRGRRSSWWVVSVCRRRYPGSPRPYA